MIQVDQETLDAFKEERDIQEKEFMELMMQNWKAAHTPKVRKYRKVGRNEMCPFCDSGLKFKQCECSTKEEYQEYEACN